MTDLGQELSNVAATSNGAVDIAEIMQQVAEHKGCGTEGGSGNAVTRRSARAP